MWGEMLVVRERGETQYRLYRVITMHNFRQSLLEDIHNVALGCSHEKSQKQLESHREKFKACSLSHLRTAGRSRQEVGVSVGSSVSEKLQKRSNTDPPNPALERCGGRGIGKLFNESYKAVWSEVLSAGTQQWKSLHRQFSSLILLQFKWKIQKSKQKRQI